MSWIRIELTYPAFRKLRGTKKSVDGSGEMEDWILTFLCPTF